MIVCLFYVLVAVELLPERKYEPPLDVWDLRDCGLA